MLARTDAVTAGPAIVFFLQRVSIKLKLNYMLAGTVAVTAGRSAIVFLLQEVSIIIC